VRAADEKRDEKVHASGGRLSERVNERRNGDEGGR
jgi:hypothetical protein